jgi:hypothetical protein
MSVTQPDRRESLRLLMLTAAAGVLLPSLAFARTVGSGRAQTETRTVAHFDAIAVSGGIQLTVRQGSTEGLQLSADDNLLPLIETVVEPGRQGSTLKIRVRRGESISTRLPMKATVDVITLQALSLAGSGRVDLGSLQTKDLRLSLAGSGDVRLDALSADSLHVRISGSGNVQGSGRSGQLNIKISGSGDVDLTPMAADEVSVGIAGSGDAQVTANKSLSVSIAGSGDVTYGGTATAISSSVAGSGKVKRR